MPKNNANASARIVPDLLNMKYEFLLKTIGRKGFCSLELKCLFLLLILYVPGLITTLLAGTWYSYIVDDWRRFIAIVFIGVFMWLMTRFVERINDEIQHVDQIISPPKKEKDQEGYKEWKNGEGYYKWRNWEKKLHKYTIWVRSGPASHKWYYFYVMLGIVAGLILNIFILDPTGVKWVQGDLLNEIYYRAWFVSLGFLMGACLHYIFGGFWIIRKYCKDVVSHEEILPLDPDRTGGLGELGRLSLDLDLIAALPSVVFPLYLFGRQSEYLASLGSSVWVGISVIYAIFLVFVFFVSISPAHDEMARAKKDYLLKIHSEYKDMHESILQKLEPGALIEPEEYKRLSGLYELYDRVKSMAVWPLDFQTTLRFSITSLLPIATIGITISVPF